MDMVLPPSNQQDNRSSGDPGIILWDIENCPIPRGVPPEPVVDNVRKNFPADGAIKFVAYGNFKLVPNGHREGLHRSGVELHDVPNGRKNAADIAIVTRAYEFAFDHPPPASIMLISGDADFAHPFNVIKQRKFTIFLVVPGWVNVSPALINAGSVVWDWRSLACGEVVPRLSTTLMHPYQAPASTAGNSMWYRTGQNDQGSNSNLGFPQLPESWSYCSPTITDLKEELVELVERSGGNLPFDYVPGDYKKYYGRVLCESKDGGFKLLDLLQKMTDALVIVDKGLVKFVYLRNSKAESCEFM